MAALPLGTLRPAPALAALDCFASLAMMSRPIVVSLIQKPCPSTAEPMNTVARTVKI